MRLEGVEITGNFEYNKFVIRTCTRCGEVKEVEQFNFKIRSRGLRSSHCRSCSSRYVKAHYENNKQYYLDKAYKRNFRIRQEFRSYIWTYLSSHPCVDCGESDPIVLEFDHVKEKSFTISSAGRNKKLADIIKEIEQCEIRCANCHRRKTSKQFGWHKNIMPL